MRQASCKWWPVIECVSLFVFQLFSTNTTDNVTCFVRYVNSTYSTVNGTLTLGRPVRWYYGHPVHWSCTLVNLQVVYPVHLMIVSKEFILSVATIHRSFEEENQFQLDKGLVM